MVESTLKNIPIRKGQGATVPNPVLKISLKDGSISVYHSAIENVSILVETFEVVSIWKFKLLNFVMNQLITWI